VPGIGVVVNPHAKGNRSESSDREKRMAEILGGDGAVRITSTLEAVDQVAHEFADRNIDILAICGGDGSDHCTLTAFHKVYAGRPLPLLLPLRAGTINYIADQALPAQLLGIIVNIGVLVAGIAIAYAACGTSIISAAPAFMTVESRP